MPDVVEAIFERRFEMAEEYKGIFSCNFRDDLPQFKGDPCNTEEWKGFIESVRIKKVKKVTSAEALEMFERGDDLDKLRKVIELVLRRSAFGNHVMVDFDWCLVDLGETPEETILLTAHVRFINQTLTVQEKIPLKEFLHLPEGVTRAKHVQLIYGQMIRDVLNTVETQIP